jgi:hypothetical protein
VTVRNCEFEAAHDASSALGFAQTSRSKVHIEQCVIRGRGPAIEFTEPAENTSVNLDARYCRCGKIVLPQLIYPRR